MASADDSSPLVVLVDGSGSEAREPKEGEGRSTNGHGEERRGGKVVAEEEEEGNGGEKRRGGKEKERRKEKRQRREGNGEQQGRKGRRERSRERKVHHRAGGRERRVETGAAVAGGGHRGHEREDKKVVRVGGRAGKEKGTMNRSRSESRGGVGRRTRRGGTRSRSRSRERRGVRRRSRSKSKSKKRARRSSSRSRHRSHSDSGRGRRQSRSRRRSRSASGDYGGYIPRRRQEAPLPGGGTSNEPFIQSQGSGCVTQDQALRQWQEQQLRSRQLILQQAVSAQAGRGRDGFSPLPCPTRQVYVGNLVPGLVSEAALRQLFNSALSAVFPESAQPGMEPVISVSMHSDGRYAFVELRTPEMATAALQLSGQVQLFGQSISVGRPSGYVDPGKAAAAAQAAAAALAAFQAADPTGRGSIPGASGQLGMVQMGMLTGTALAASPASAFICVEGMVTLDTLTSDTTYRKVIADLRNECVKHGAVIQLKIPRPADPKMAQVLYSTGFYGKAFVQFSDATAATRAREGLNGHSVHGHTLAVTFVSQEVFAAII